MLVDFLDNNLRHRESMGETLPMPGRLRLTGDVAPGTIYDNLLDFFYAIADIAVSNNVEIESSGGLWLPVDLLWGLLALRRYETISGTARTPSP